MGQLEQGMGAMDAPQLHNIEYILHKTQVTLSQNKRKIMPKGVSYCRKSNKYKARIYYNGKTHWLGDFKTVDEAASAYLRERLLHPRVNHWEQKKRAKTEKGAPVYGRTALILAAREGHEAIVDRLINAGADVDVENRI